MKPTVKPSHGILMHAWFQKALDLVHPARSVRRVRRSAEEQDAANRAAVPLTLYHFRSCPYCLRVRRAVHRLNIPIALRDIHIDPAAHRALLAGGGRQTVPCLYIDDPAGGDWLYESAAIIDYLNRRFAPARGIR